MGNFVLRRLWSYKSFKGFKILKNNIFVNISTNLFSQCMSFTKPSERNSVWSATMWSFPNVPSGPFIPMSS